MNCTLVTRQVCNTVKQVIGACVSEGNDLQCFSEQVFERSQRSKKTTREIMHDKVGWRVVSVYRLHVAIARSLVIVGPGHNGNVGQPQSWTIEDAR